MSDANLASLAHRKTAAAGANYRKTRITAESLKNSKETVTSAEIRSDRQVPDLAKVGSQPDGGFNFELSYFAFQDFMAAVLASSWVTVNLTESVTMTASTQIVAGAAGDFDDIIVGGLYKFSGAAANALNLGNKRVVAKAADGSTITLAAGSIVANESAFNLTIRGKVVTNGVVQTPFDFEKRIVNNAGDDFFEHFEGMVADTMELRIESKRIVTGSFGFIGLSYNVGAVGEDEDALSPVKAAGVLTLAGNAVAAETITIGGVVYTWAATADDEFEVEVGGTASESIDNLIAEINGAGLSPVHPSVTAAAGAGDTMNVEAILPGTAGNAIATTETMTNGSWGAVTLTGGVTQSAGYDEAETGSILNGTSNMGSIMIDGAVAADRFKSITLNLANSARGKDALGIDGNFEIGLGTMGVTGSLNAYFRNTDLPLKIKNHVSFGLSFNLTDDASNLVDFYLPNTKPAQGNPTITGINTDVMIETNFQAIADLTGTGKTIIISAIDA